MLISTIFYVTIFTAVQYILFSLYLFSVKKNRILSNRILALFLFTTGIRLIDITFFTGLIAWITVFSIGPLIYLYTKSLVINKFRLDVVDNVNNKLLLEFLISLLLTEIIFFSSLLIISASPFKDPIANS